MRKLSRCVSVRACVCVMLSCKICINLHMLYMYYRRCAGGCTHTCETHWLRFFSVTRPWKTDSKYSLSSVCLVVFMSVCVCVFDFVYVSRPTQEEGTERGGGETAPHHLTPSVPPSPQGGGGGGQQKKFLKFFATDTVALVSALNLTCTLSHSREPTTGEESKESRFIAELVACSKASNDFGLPESAHMCTQLLQGKTKEGFTCISSSQATSADGKVKIWIGGNTSNDLFSYIFMFRYVYVCYAHFPPPRVVSSV